MALEYVHELREPAVTPELAALTKLGPVAAECRRLVARLREQKPSDYELGQRVSRATCPRESPTRRRGISAERCWLMLERVPDLHGVTKDEYLELVEHMKREGYLFEAGGLLSMGQKAEKVFGKKNFLELYAVFSTPQLYKVQTESKRDLGSLEQAFVDRLVDEMSTFLLGGRAWLVVSGAPLSLNCGRAARVRAVAAGPFWIRSSCYRRR
jgi:hypothetical protein